MVQAMYQALLNQGIYGILFLGSTLQEMVNALSTIARADSPLSAYHDS